MLVYFQVGLGDHYKSWAPHTVCKPCKKELRQWVQGLTKYLSFGVPVVQREQKNHYDEFYFFSINVKGVNHKNKNLLAYPYLPFAKMSITHCNDASVSMFTALTSLAINIIEQDHYLNAMKEYVAPDFQAE